MSKASQILIVEDDENLRLTLIDILDGEGYGVEQADTVSRAQGLLEENTFQLIILDLMLPDGDGYSVCRQLREAGNNTPVLMLTARSLEDDLVKGFDVGADDYLVKPYRVKELLARVRALLKRDAATRNADKFNVNGFIVDRGARTIKQDDANVEVTPKEFDIFIYLWDHPHRAVSRDQLLENIWGEVIVDPRTVDNFISSLKKKLCLSTGNSIYIETVRGVGYRLER